MFSIQIQVWIERRFSVVGILPDDYDAPGVSCKAHRLGDGHGRPGALDGYIHPAPVCMPEHPITPIGGSVFSEIEDILSAHSTGIGQPLIRRPDAKHTTGASQYRKSNSMSFISR